MSVQHCWKLDRTLCSGQRKHLLVVALCAFIALSSTAQKSEIYQNEMSGYRLGMELFEKRKFGAAQREFERISEVPGDPNSDLKANAEYYLYFLSCNECWRYNYWLSTR